MRFLFLAFCIFPLLASSQDTVKVGVNVPPEVLAEQEFNRGLAALNSQDFQTAAEYFTRCLALKPQHDKALANRGITYAKMRKSDDALTDLNAAIAINPANADHYYYKSLIFNEAGKTDSQEVQLTKCLQINPLHAEASYHRGLLAYNRHAWPEAIDYFSNAITSRRDFIDAYNDRGSAKRAKGDIAGAIADYEKALVFDSTRIFVINNLASAHRLNKSYDKAIYFYTNALSKSPGYHIALLNRGAAKFESGNLTGAKEDFEKLLAAEPGNAAAYNNLASIAIKNKDYGKARELATKAISLDKSNGPAYYNRAIARQMLRDENGCCDDWKKAADLGVESARSYHSISCPR